jgi:SAM-dependent methyltransferase
MQSIHDYYDTLAKDYDQNRFGNSYGRYIDRLERKILQSWLNNTPPTDVVDLACGTGRLLQFAMTGVDASAEMLRVARNKFPDRLLKHSTLPKLDLPDASFSAATCFHVLMHLDEALIKQSFAEIARVIKVGGRLIVDIPSQDRRALNRRRPNNNGWHGNTAATQTDVIHWSSPHWRLVKRRGILFIPIHRLPSFARAFFGGIDALIGRTFLARYSSYHVYELERIA